MAEVFYKINKQTLDEIANAIREGNPNAPLDMKGEDFATYIRGISDSSFYNFLKGNPVDIYAELTTIPSLSSSKSIINVEMPNIKTLSTQLKGCPNLASAKFDNLTSIESYGFQSCSNLKTFIAPKLENIGSYTFDGCSSMETFIAPKITSVGNNSLWFSKLEKLYLPNLISGADKCISGIKNLFLGATPPTLRSGYTVDYRYNSEKYYVPKGSKETYTAISQWNEIASNIYEYDTLINIDGTEYNSYVLTFGDWILTENNTLGLTAFGNNIIDTNGKYLMNGTKFVNPTDTIDQTINYTLEVKTNG